MKPPSIYIVFQRATFRSGLENQHFRILADLAANPINTVLLGHAHFWKNVPKSWKSIENEPILKFPGWDSGVFNPRTIIRLIRPLPTPKSGLKNQKSSKIQNIRNPKVYTKFVRQPKLDSVSERCSCRGRCRNSSACSLRTCQRVSDRWHCTLAHGLYLRTRGERHPVDRQI